MVEHKVDAMQEMEGDPSLCSGDIGHGSVRTDQDAEEVLGLYELIHLIRENGFFGVWEESRLG